LLPRYDVTLLDDGSYYFVTKSGLEYKALFVDNSDLFSRQFQSFEFQFYPINSKKRKGVDEKVKNTIIYLITEFLANEVNVLIFVCDSADNGAESRRNLFAKWHKYSELEFVHKQDFEIIGGQEEKIFASALLNKTNPQFENIIQIIADTREDFQSYK
jgi:hypothetical protein